MSLKLQVNLSAKVIYSFVFVVILFSLVAGVLASYNYQLPFGHGGDTVWVRTPQGMEMTLQDAIDQGVFSSSISGEGLTGRPVKSIAFSGGSSGGSTCVITTDDVVRCSGRNDYYQLGIGDSSNRNRFQAVGGGGGLDEVKELSGSRLGFCALLNDGTAKCWGYNGYGQLGDGTTTDRNLPASVLDSAGGSLSNIKKLELRSNQHAYEYACAVINDGKIKCWGYNGYGQLGVGDTTGRLKATEVSGITTAKEVQLGGHSSGGFTCAALNDGTAKCWGYNGYGQLGDGTTTSRSSPVSVSGLSNVRSIYTVEDDYGFACALLNDGTAKCWGYNGYGQLGDGTTTSRSSPVSVQNIGGAYPKAVHLELVGAGSGSSVCALLDDGKVRCWGYNGYGQLGVGDTTSRSVPTTVSSLSNVVAINGTSYGAPGYFCALLGDGSVKCWGYNGYSQLGDGTTTTRNTPVVISSLSNVKTLGMSGQSYAQYACAILTSGTLNCWGYNGYGGLGTGNQITSTIPTEIY